MAHSLITGKLEDLAPISQRLVKLSLEDSTTGGTVSDLPGLFPSLKHLRIETQAVRGRRWSEETEDAGGSTVTTDSPPSRVVLVGAPGSWNKLMGEYELQSK